MPDREKIIAWLTEISLRPCDFATDDFDAYETEHLANEALEIYEDAKVFNQQRNDAIALLKEQEAKPVMESTNMYTGLPITHCPKCGISLDRYLYGRQYEGQINYCPMCGQAVKWE